MMEWSRFLRRGSLNRHILSESKFVNFVREGEGGPTKTQNLDSGAGPSVMGFWTL